MSALFKEEEMKNKFALLLAFSLSLVALFSGCSSMVINKEAMANVGKVGVLSVAVEKINPDTTANYKVLSQIANASRVGLEKALKSEMGLKVVPVTTLVKYKAFKNAGNVALMSGAQSYLKNQAETNPRFAMAGNMADALKALMSGKKVSKKNQSDAVSSFTSMAQGQLKKAGEKFVKGPGMPLIPYHIFNDTKQGVVEHKVTMGNAAQEDTNHMKEMMLVAVGKLCKQLKLDAMVVAYLPVVAPPLGSIRVIAGDRCMGHIKMNTTIVMIDKNGQIIADTGWRVMDDLAPSRSVLPMYRVTKWRKTSKGKKYVGAAVTDLNEPSGKIKRQLNDLANETAVNTIREIANAMKAE